MMNSARKVVLSDRYQIGEELGRGAYGQVFKGIDLINNLPVAIKQISLAGMSAENLQGVQGEIELLKTLNHANIVKYIGSFKTRTHLYIILEFMESGALSAMIKPGRMGVFPEHLVAVYITQVLQGLQYLHEQGVVHRDIKGANILTHKNLVKLADFGVAARLGELEDRRDELHQHVVGTPYWMAPEVIEMTQVGPASDIWSVGCLIIEMLTGSPPYYELQPMSALFRIVQDECPPLPEGISPLMQDFLMRCFQKDPRRRPSAQELLQHEWLRQSCNTLRNSWRRHGGGLGMPSNSADYESVTSVVARMMDLGEGDTDSAAVPGTPLSPSQVLLSEASRRATPSPLRDGALAAGAVPSPPLDTPAGAASAMASPHTPPPPPGPLAAGAAAGPVPLPPMQGTPDSAWGTPGVAQPVAGPITSLVSMLGGVPQVPGQQGGQVGGQLAPWLKDADRSMPVPGGRASGGAGGQQGAGLAGPQGSNGLGGWDPRTGLAPGDSGPSFELGPTANSMFMDLRKQVRELVRALRPLPGGGRDPNGMSPAAACHTLAGLVATSPDAKQLMMNETGALVLLELLDTDNPRNVEGAIELLMAITQNDLVTLETICLLGVVPAAAKYALPPYPASLRLRTAGFLARFFNSGPSTLAHFVACQGLKTLVAMVADLPLQKTQLPVMNSSPAAFQQAAQQLAPMSTNAENPGLALSQVAINCIFQFLDCYNILPHSYLCRLLAQNGLVPRLYIVLKETIVQLARPQNSTTKQQPTASAGSLNSPGTWRQGGGMGAYQTVDPRQANKAISPPERRIGSQTVDPRAMRTTKESAPVEEFSPLAVPVLTHEELAPLQEAAVSLLLLLSNADTLVKGFCCTRENLQHLLDCLGRLAPPSLIRLMRALRWLTCEHTMLPAIKDSGAIAVLVPFLARERVDIGGLPAAQVQIEALHALYNICKFNKVHLEAAATVGITPHLCWMAAEGVAALQQQRQQTGGVSPRPRTPNGRAAAGEAQLPSDDELLNPQARWERLRGFVVPLMIALVAASSSTRAKLWSAGGPDLFLALLSDPDSVELGVPGALELWLAEDHARMEPKLTQREPVQQLVALYARVAQAQDTNVLPALLSVLRSMIGRSSKLAVALALGPGGIVPPLLAMIDNAAPILRVKILEILGCLYEHYPRPKEFLLLHRIQEVLVRLLESSGRGADAVHQGAQRLLTAFQINVLF